MKLIQALLSLLLLPIKIIQKIVPQKGNDANKNKPQDGKK